MGGFVPATYPGDSVLPIDGLRDTSSILSTRVVADVKDAVTFIEPEATPLVSITRGIKKSRTATQYRYDWIERDPYPETVKVSGAQTSGDTSVEVITGDGDKVMVDGIYKNLRTGELIIASSEAADVITAVRGHGAVAAQAMVDGDILYLVSTAHADGGTLGSLKSVKERGEYNYTQIIRTAYGVTGRMQHTKLYGGADMSTERKAAAILHKKKVEKAFIFGSRDSRTHSTGKLQTTTGGILETLKTNRWNLGGQAPSWDAVCDVLAHQMRWGNGGQTFGRGVKTLFCSSQWISLFGKILHNKVDYEPMHETLGVMVGAVKTPHGTINLVHEPIFDFFHEDLALLLDLGHISYVAHQGRDTKILKDRQANDEDSTKEELFVDCGIQVEVEMAHAVWSGLGTGGE